jgi:protein TonB
MCYRLFLFVFCLGLGPVALQADDALEPPVPVRTVAPKYPTDLKRDGVSGVVSVKCTIDEKGNVTEPTVVKTTHEAFSGPAIDALSKWKFKPAKRGGTVVAIKITIPIQFNCSD